MGIDRSKKHSGQEIVIIVDITRSTPGRLFESPMTRAAYERLLAKGKLTNWRLKSEIDSIKQETTDYSTKESKVEIVQLNDNSSDEELDDSIDIELLNLEELKNFAKENGVKHHPAAKEKGIIKALKTAGY